MSGSGFLVLWEFYCDRLCGSHRQLTIGSNQARANRNLPVANLSPRNCSPSHDVPIIPFRLSHWVMLGVTGRIARVVARGPLFPNRIALIASQSILPHSFSVASNADVRHFKSAVPALCEESKTPEVKAPSGKVSQVIGAVVDVHFGMSRSPLPLSSSKPITTPIFY